MSPLRLFERRPNDTWTETLHRRRSDFSSLRLAGRGLIARGQSWTPRGLLHLALAAWLWRLAAPHVFRRLAACWVGFGYRNWHVGTIGDPPLTLNC